LEARGVASERIDPNGGVGAPRRVALKRSCPQTGVGLRRRNPRQRERQNEYSHKDGEKRSSVGRMTKHIIPSLHLSGLLSLSLLLDHPIQRQLVYQLRFHVWGCQADPALREKQAHEEQSNQA
jgi:hypothetical protein